VKACIGQAARWLIVPDSSDFTEIYFGMTGYLADTFPFGVLPTAETYFDVLDDDAVPISLATPVPGMPERDPVHWAESVGGVTNEGLPGWIHDLAVAALWASFILGPVRERAFAWLSPESVV
jgi:hypothetical protein